MFIVGLPTRTQAPKQQRLCLSSSPWVPVHKAGPNLNWCLDICGVKMNDHRECLQRRGSSWGSPDSWPARLVCALIHPDILRLCVNRGTWQPDPAPLGTSSCWAAISRPNSSLPLQVHHTDPSSQVTPFSEWPSSKDWQRWGYKGPAKSGQGGTSLRVYFSPSIPHTARQGCCQACLPADDKLKL